MPKLLFVFASVALFVALAPGVGCGPSQPTVVKSQRELPKGAFKADSGQSPAPQRELPKGALKANNPPNTSK